MKSLREKSSVFMVLLFLVAVVDLLEAFLPPIGEEGNHHRRRQFCQRKQLAPVGTATAAGRLKSKKVEVNQHQNAGDEESSSLTRRRSMFMSSALALFSLFSAMTTSPRPSYGGVDVSGLPVEGGAQLSQQLKTFSSSSSSSPASPSSSTPRSSGKAGSFDAYAEEPQGAATYAIRSSPGPRLSKVGITGLKTRYEDQVYGPAGRPRSLDISFEFPTDWLQLDKFTGGIQFVDQRNGDKMYVLRATLPPDKDLESIDKKWFGKQIFDPQGTFVKSGNDVEDFRVSSSTVTNQVVPCIEKGACSVPRRRLLAKYATVTGNGLRVERRGLVDAYQVDDQVYMLLTSSNAVKFEANGRERETVEAIVDSFRVQ